jgi:hypothetical protein
MMREAQAMNRTTTMLTAALAILTVSGPAHAQRFGNPNAALPPSAADPAALGSGDRGFLRLSAGDNVSWMVGAGIGMAGGMLRASYGEGNLDRFIGIGYARRVFGKSLGTFGTFISGLDVAAGYDANKYLDYAPRAAKLAIPLSLRWGSPSRVSLAPYVAPYAEIGRAIQLHARCEQFSCTGPISYSNDLTHAAGLGIGFEMTAWRFGLEAGVRDVLLRPEVTNTAPVDSRQGTLGLRLRF